MVEVKPSNNLQAALDKGGEITLLPGEHLIDPPLVISVDGTRLIFADGAKVVCSTVARDSRDMDTRIPMEPDEPALPWSDAVRVTGDDCHIINPFIDANGLAAHGLTTACRRVFIDDAIICNARLKQFRVSQSGHCPEQITVNGIAVQSAFALSSVVNHGVLIDPGSKPAKSVTIRDLYVGNLAEGRGPSTAVKMATADSIVVDGIGNVNNYRIVYAEGLGQITLRRGPWMRYPVNYYPPDDNDHDLSIRYEALYK